MPQIREQIAMVHLPPSKTLKYLFHVRKTDLRSAIRNGLPAAFLLCSSTMSGILFISPSQ